MTDFKSTNDYAKLNTLKNRNKNLEIKDIKYKYMDTTGSYVGFKENKKGPIYMCSCCKDGIRKDIEIINRIAKRYDKYDFFDVVWYTGDTEIRVKTGHISSEHIGITEFNSLFLYLN